MTGLEKRCRETLEASWTVGERDGVPFAYTRPSPERYRWQWYWDSCFWRGMVRLGYEQQTAALACAITETVAREGLREFYDPHDARGMGAKDFAWSAIALELLDRANANAGIPIGASPSTSPKNGC